MKNNNNDNKLQKLSRIYRREYFDRAYSKRGIFFGGLFVVVLFIVLIILQITSPHRIFISK